MELLWGVNNRPSASRCLSARWGSEITSRVPPSFGVADCASQHLARPSADTPVAITTVGGDDPGALAVLIAADPCLSVRRVQEHIRERLIAKKYSSLVQLTRSPSTAQGCLRLHRSVLRRARSTGKPRVRKRGGHGSPQFHPRFAVLSQDRTPARSMSRRPLNSQTHGRPPRCLLTVC